VRWQAVVISKVMLDDVIFKFAPISVVPMLAFGLAMHFACAGGGGGDGLPSSLTNSLKLVLGQVRPIWLKGFRQIHYLGRGVSWASTNGLLLWAATGEYCHRSNGERDMIECATSNMAPGQTRSLQKPVLGRCRTMTAVPLSARHVSLRVLSLASL
jgi:hypothetical protein